MYCASSSLPAAEAAAAAAVAAPSAAEAAAAAAELCNNFRPECVELTSHDIPARVHALMLRSGTCMLALCNDRCSDRRAHDNNAYFAAHAQDQLHH